MVQKQYCTQIKGCPVSLQQKQQQQQQQETGERVACRSANWILFARQVSSLSESIQVAIVCVVLVVSFQDLETWRSARRSWTQSQVPPVSGKTWINHLSNQSLTLTLTISELLGCDLEICLPKLSLLLGEDEICMQDFNPSTKSCYELKFKWLELHAIKSTRTFINLTSCHEVSESSATWRLVYQIAWVSSWNSRHLIEWTFRLTPMLTSSAKKLVARSLFSLEKYFGKLAAPSWWKLVALELACSMTTMKASHYLVGCCSLGVASNIKD